MQFHYLQYKSYKQGSGPMPFDQPGPKWPRFKTRQNMGMGMGIGGGGVVPFDLLIEVVVDPAKMK